MAADRKLFQLFVRISPHYYEDRGLFCALWSFKLLNPEDSGSEGFTVCFSRQETKSRDYFSALFVWPLAIHLL